MTGVTKDRGDDEIVPGASLGHLRLRHQETNEIILIPTPSNDPNDPLNWSSGYRIYLAVLVCLAMFFCNFLAAGPTVAIVDITIDFFGTPPTDPRFVAAVSKIAYCFTTTALLQGTGNLFWMPLILKYGRRPVYIISFTCYTATAIWAGVSTTFASELASRILMGFFAGAGECMGPLTIADLFFLHERGLYMSMYTAALSAGVSGGIIIAGLITINNSWRYIYYVATALIGALTLLVFFTLPETSYIRAIPQRDNGNVETVSNKASEHFHGSDNKDIPAQQIEGDIELESASTTAPVYKKQSFSQKLRLSHGRFTNESLWKIAYRPVVLIVLPPILWATLVMSVTIGFLVAISSNFASAFTTVYDFAAWQSGLCFISGLIGTMLGIFGGGYTSDKVADYFTLRNNGIREPEHRLPAMMIGLVCAPLALVLYGVGIQDKLHWMVPTLGLGILSFAIAQCTNVSLVYVIDSYRPIAGETVVTQLAYKSCFGFLLSFYTNPWIAKSGYAGAFGAMAGIAGGVILLWVPLFIWGRRIRQATTKWKVVTMLIDWDQDREVGE